jgi:NAD(P)-dependent dehydrogenase (short-subunit alcohol dehydrogenase family)
MAGEKAMSGPGLLDLGGQAVLVTGAGQGAGRGIALMLARHNAGGIAVIRVLDFTAFPPGGACTVMLADPRRRSDSSRAAFSEGQTSLVVGQVPLSRASESGCC